MTNKNLVLKMGPFIFSFLLIFVSCPIEKEEKPIEGPLFGLRFWGVRELTTKEISRLDSAAESYGNGFFGEEGKPNTLDLHAVKIDDKWYALPITTIGGRGDYWWYFGREKNLGKKMEKWETTWTRVDYGVLRSGEALREEKDFEYVDQTSIKIDDQTYKYSLKQSATREYQINNPDGSSWTMAIYFKALRIYYDGIGNPPTLYIYIKTSTVK